MDLLEHHRLMAGYNQWFNRNLLEACAKVPPERMFEDQQAFFGSLGGTLNHLIVTDCMWLRRFAEGAGGAPIRAALDWLPAPTRLNQVLLEDLPSIVALRERIDALIVQWVEQLTPADLDTSLEYRNSRGSAFKRSLGLLISHLFNHETHHRGQATTLLFRLGVDPGATDLLVRIPNELPA